MSKELKIGLLSIGILFLMIWGYKFLKGKNLFHQSSTYYITYDNVDQLTVSSPVMMKGFKVGAVTEIALNPENIEELIVTIEVDGKIGLPKETVAVLYSAGIVGGKAIALEFNTLCTDDCLENKSYIKGETRGLLSSMLPEQEINEYLGAIQTEVSGLLDSAGLGSGNGSENPAEQVKMVLKNLASITQSLDVLLKKSDSHIQKSLSDIQSFTGTLKQNQSQLNTLVDNLEAFSNQLAKAEVDQTVGKADTAIQAITVAVADLKNILSNADNSFNNLDKMITQVQQGEGSLGKLVSSDSMYNDLQNTVNQLNFLLQDVRLNPRRYLNLSVIGGKSSQYVKPQDDPALK